jgi:hypothetical protein
MLSIGSSQPSRRDYAKRCSSHDGGGRRPAWNRQERARTNDGHSAWMRAFPTLSGPNKRQPDPAWNVSEVKWFREKMKFSVPGLHEIREGRARRAIQSASNANAILGRTIKCSKPMRLRFRAYPASGNLGAERSIPRRTPGRWIPALLPALSQPARRKMRFCRMPTPRTADHPTRRMAAFPPPCSCETSSFVNHFAAPTIASSPMLEFRLYPTNAEVGRLFQALGLKGPRHVRGPRPAAPDVWAPL